MNVLDVRREAPWNSDRCLKEEWPTNHGWGQWKTEAQTTDCFLALILALFSVGFETKDIDQFVRLFYQSWHDAIPAQQIQTQTQQNAINDYV